MPKMVQFRATAKGYYGDVIHDPDTNHHVIFDAPEDWSASWAERVDGKAPAEKVVEVSEETLAAEKILDTESEAARPDVPEATEEAKPEVSEDDIPADAGDAEDASKAAGVEVL